MFTESTCFTRYTADRNSAFGVRRSAFGVRRSAFGVRRSAFGVRRSAFGVRRSAFGVRRSAFGVRRSAFGVRRSAFGVRRSAFGVRRSAFGVRRSAFGVLHSAFGVRQITPAGLERAPENELEYPGLLGQSNYISRCSGMCPHFLPICYVLTGRSQILGTHWTNWDRVSIPPNHTNQKNTYLFNYARRSKVCW